MTGVHRTKSSSLKSWVLGLFQRPIRTNMNDDLPTVIVKETESHHTADDVVEIIYLQNDTDRIWVATVRANFTTTVDDESGQALHHGSAGTEVKLAPGERARVGDVLGWELDSSLGLQIEFRHPEGNGARVVHYMLEFGGPTREVDGLGVVYEPEPLTMKALD